MKSITGNSSYFDRRSFESKPPTHIPAGHHSESAKPVHSQSQPNFSSYSSKGKPETDAVDRSFSEKCYDPTQATPPPPPLPSQYSQSAPPLSSSSLHIHSKGSQGEGNSGSLDFQNSYMSKPDPPPPQSTPAAFRPPAREDPPQTFYPQKSFPDKAPVNGAKQTQKTITPAYNRFTPKPYTSSAQPFERIFNSNGGVLSSIETGVSIIIPQGAIPEGIEQEIYFKVCRHNSILPPLDKEKGETLLSFLEMCGPHGLKFLKPVELRLPHCDPKAWQNKCLPGDPNYLVGANCVSVLIDHF